MKRSMLLLPLILLLLFGIVSPSYALIAGFRSSCLAGGSPTIGIRGEPGYKAFLDAAKLLIIPEKAPKPNWTTYFFMCYGAENKCGARSTTGENINLKLFGPNSKNDTPGSIVHGSNPSRTNAGFGTGASGFINAAGQPEEVIWAMTTKHGITHRFYWVQAETDGAITSPVVTLQPNEYVYMDDSVGDDTGLKIGQLSFDQPEPTIVPGVTPTVPASGVKCSNMKWDPRGFLFDAETLNPVQDVTITLFQKQVDKSYIQVPQDIGLTNPLTTASDSGQFNFFVEPGFYKMTIDPRNAQIADKSSLNPSYNELFVDSKGNTNIYEKDTDVEEIAGRVAVSHIPVKITNKKLIIDTLQLLLKDAVVNTEPSRKTKMHITGTVSHPKSKVTITSSYIDTQGNQDILPPEVIFTNEMGEYDTYVNQEQLIPSKGQIYLQNINVKLSLNDFYAKTSSNPRTISYDVKPLPLYLEGIAYDATGKAIPNAVVGVYPFYSLNPMHLVLADKNGRFKFGSQNVPEVDYTIKYESPSGEVTVIEPMTFVKQNIKFHTNEGINPYQTQTISERDIAIMNAKVDKRVTEKTIASMSRTTLKPGSLYSTSRDTTPIPNAQRGGSSANISLIVTLITILGLVGAAVVVGVQMKAKSTF